MGIYLVKPIWFNVFTLYGFVKHCPLPPSPGDQDYGYTIAHLLRIQSIGFFFNLKKILQRMLHCCCMWPSFLAIVTNNGTSMVCTCGLFKFVFPLRCLIIYTDVIFFFLSGYLMNTTWILRLIWMCITSELYSWIYLNERMTEWLQWWNEGCKLSLSMNSKNCILEFICQRVIKRQNIDYPYIIGKFFRVLWDMTSELMACN